MKKNRKVITLIIICAMLLAQILPAATALAADLTDSFAFITAVKLTDISGKALGDNVAKDSALKLEYDYEIPNPAVVKAGDTVTLNIPQQILIAVPESFDLQDDQSRLIGTGTLGTDGKITIAFTSFVQTYSNVHGNFWFDLSFNKDKIGNSNPVTITFNVGATTPPYKIDINFEQPAPVPATIHKSGAYNAAAKTITWTATIDPENVEVDNATVTDTIASGQTLVPGYLKINGSDADSSDYSYDSGTGVLTYTFPTAINTQQTLVYKTTLNDSVFFSSSEGATVTAHNTAVLHSEGHPDAESNDATINTTVDFIRKSGSFDYANKAINWTITVDNNYVTIPNAVVTDTIPDGLTLDPASVKLDGSSTLPSGTTGNLSGQDFTFTFGDPISGPHTITFTTSVTPDLFKTNGTQIYTNTAYITGTGVPDNTKDTKVVGATSSMIEKSGSGYDAASGIITWYIRVDRNNISVQNCTVTDYIPVGLKYIDGSLSLSSGSVTPTVSGETTGPLTLTFGDITAADAITYKTQITDPTVYKNNKDVYYTNTASIHGDNIGDSQGTGNQHVTGQIISKTCTDYDYQTRELTWQIVVNKNQNELTNIVVTDDIKPGQTYVADSETISGGADPTGFTYAAADASDTTKTGTLSYNFGSGVTINTQYTITFKTVVSDLSVFGTNGDKTFSNTAKIVHDDLPAGVTSMGSRTVHNTVISKTGSYSAGNKYIDWTITINTNTVPLSDATVTDTLQQGLALDTSSIKLYHMTLKTDGTLAKGDEIDLSPSNVQYILSTRTLTFHIPSPVSGAYELTLRTNVTDKSKSPFTNSASFSGTGSEQKDTSQQIAVSWAGSGSSGIGEVGSIRVYKVDSRDSSVIAEPGCVFDLIDRFGNIVDEETTGTGGYVLFSLLRFDINYTVKEVKPPAGYLITGEPYTFQIHGSDDVHDIEYRYADDVIRGNITLNKYDMDMAPVPGTGFTLYDSQNNTAATASSDSAGLVEFKDIPYGNYTIKETAPAEGFLGSDTVLSASVSEDGATVTATPGYVQDGRIYGSITMFKAASDGTTALPGATFKLYKSTDTDFKSPVTTAVSDASGIVLFQNIQYGNYVIRETAAPDGYAVSSIKVSVSVAQNGATVNAGTFTDKKTTHDHSPQTGDDIYFYIGIFVLSAIGIAAIIVTAARSKRRQGSLK